MERVSDRDMSRIGDGGGSRTSMCSSLKGGMMVLVGILRSQSQRPAVQQTTAPTAPVVDLLSSTVDRSERLGSAGYREDGAEDGPLRD